MEAFRVEKIAESVHVAATSSTTKCRCGGALELVRKMLEAESGRVINMYQCECGDRTWSEDRLDVSGLSHC